MKKQTSKLNVKWPIAPHQLLFGMSGNLKNQKEFKKKCTSKTDKMHMHCSQRKGVPKPKSIFPFSVIGKERHENVTNPKAKLMLITKAKKKKRKKYRMFRTLCTFSIGTFNSNCGAVAKNKFICENQKKPLKSKN